MPPIYINGQEVVKRYVGIQEVVAAYVGAQQIFSSGVSLAQIQALFASGEIGVILDYKDATALFQDNLGVTPVTADGQPVGMILDKSNGLALGAEQLVNGDFNSGTGWSLVGPSISGGNLTFSSSALNDYAANSGGISAANVLFEITFTITSIASGSVRAQAGGRAGTARTSAGTYSERLVSIAGAALAIVATSANTTAVISDISLKVVTGNHAYQATSAARPLYAATGLSKWVNYDVVDDAMVITFASSLGSNCTIARANVGSAPTILTGQTIGTSYSDSTDNAGLIIINRALTGQETAALTTYLTQMGATT